MCHKPTGPEAGPEYGRSRGRVTKTQLSVTAPPEKAEPWISQVQGRERKPGFLHRASHKGGQYDFKPVASPGYEKQNPLQAVFSNTHFSQDNAQVMSSQRTNTRKGTRKEATKTDQKH